MQKHDIYINYYRPNKKKKIRNKVDIKDNTMQTQTELKYYIPF